MWHEFLTFRLRSLQVVKHIAQYEYPDMTKTLGRFKLNVKKGQFSDSEIIVMLGENGTGKTTFIRMYVNSWLCWPTHNHANTQAQIRFSRPPRSLGACPSEDTR